MASKNKPRIPRGMRDILPQQMIKRDYVMGIVREVFETYGYEPLQTSSIELAETLDGKYGDEAADLIYDTSHRRGSSERLSLRYDLSVPLARVVAMYDQELAKPFKRYHIAPVWRADRPQKGRYREFYQCDVDVVGTASMSADAEIVAIIYEVLHRLGFTAFTIHINNRKILTGIGQYAGVSDALLPGLYRSIDKLDKIGVDGVAAELRQVGMPYRFLQQPYTLESDADGNETTQFRARVDKNLVARALDALRAEDQDQMRAILRDGGVDEASLDLIDAEIERWRERQEPVISDETISKMLELIQIDGSNAEIIARLRETLSQQPIALEGINELAEMLNFLEQMGIPQANYRIDPAMVRGMAYYTGPIFETTIEEPKMPSIQGGGRFDELIGIFSDHTYPTVGMSLGIERIIDAMDELNMFPASLRPTLAEVVVTLFDEERRPHSLAAAQTLRRAGIKTELVFDPDGLGNQFKYANKRGIPFAVIIGPDEADNQQVTVRNLDTREQRTVARAELVSTVQTWLRDNTINETGAYGDH